jgi:chromosome segregation ATPase
VCLFWLQVLFETWAAAAKSALEDYKAVVTAETAAMAEREANTAIPTNKRKAETALSQTSAAVTHLSNERTTLKAELSELTEAYNKASQQLKKKFKQTDTKFGTANAALKKARLDVEIAESTQPKNVAHQQLASLKQRQQESNDALKTAQAAIPNF